MAFMQPQIEHGKFLILDGPVGGECVPADLLDPLEVQSLVERLKLASSVPVSGKLRDYTENRRVYQAELKLGWFARLSAPGYLDRTTWGGPFESEEAARKYLDENYGDAP